MAGELARYPAPRPRSRAGAYHTTRLQQEPAYASATNPGRLIDTSHASQRSGGPARRLTPDVCEPKGETIEWAVLFFLEQRGA